MMRIKLLIALFICIGLTGCVTTPPPRNVNNICQVFKQYPRWYSDALDVQKRWRVPIAVQMAIIHQESKFDATAEPARTKLLWIIPWTRPSTAYGYAQALRSTWRLYKQSTGRVLANRSDFFDGVDFIGWYANQAHRRAGIQRYDAYSLYLAYHEGIQGYQRKTYLKKRWLLPVAHKVKARAYIYQAQLAQCQKSLPTSRSWYRIF
jgi:hypothetical protein